jgi:hypothetical protein
MGEIARPPWCPNGNCSWGTGLVILNPTGPTTANLQGTVLNATFAVNSGIFQVTDPFDGNCVGMLPA